MKILFTGKPNKGSWQIRAVQMAEGIGKCIPFATVKDCRGADFIVALKRVPGEVIQAIRASGKPWAWDAIDAYPQPQCAGWTAEQAIHWARGQVKSFRPNVVCWANNRMKHDVGLEGVVIPHHARPGIPCNPIREHIRLIGYEGATQFLGPWAAILERAAKRIGAKFTDQPSSLAECDVVVALRGGQADCYVTRNWKSNVKLANAHASGTPFIGQKDPGYTETMTGEEHWVENEKDLNFSLSVLASQENRRHISQVFQQSTLSLKDCQAKWLEVARAYV